jgi:hypothetical protein
MNLDGPARRLARIPERPWRRVTIYYVVVLTVMGVLVKLFPATVPYLNAPPPMSGFPGGGHGDLGDPVQLSASRVLLRSLVSLTSACLLMLPVTWVYTQTRRKKGFDQSIVQALIILPLVVAGIILLVQNSTALAFSLGGIVGAVAFRNRLRDTKDAIYLFLAIVIGVAAGVHAMVVAAAISIAFNIANGIMWWTDFGHAGAPLEGRPAVRRLRETREAKAQANRSSGFISMVDKELLQSMTPEQLDALADRTRERLHQAAASAAMDEELKARRDWTLRLEVAGTALHARNVVDPLLEQMVKQWRFMRAQPSAGGTEALEYLVRIKKKDDQAGFLSRFRAAAGATVKRAELSQPRSG